MKMKRAMLGELCDLRIGRTPSRNLAEFWRDGRNRWLSISDMDEPVIRRTKEAITDFAVKEAGCNLVEPGTLLLSFKLSLGKVAFAGIPLFTNEAIAALPIRKPSELDSRYLYYRLQSFDWAGLGRRAVKGNCLNKEILEQAKIEYPSALSEQRRIAGLLEQADRLRRTRRYALELSDTFLPAAFHELFGQYSNCSPVSISEQPRDLPQCWRYEKLVDVARLATGHTPSRNVEEYWNGTIPWITLTDIRALDGQIATSTSEYTTEAGIKNSSAVKLPSGTVCFSRTASVGFVTVMGREMCTSQDFVNWVCGPDLNPIFLMHALIASRQELRSLATGSTHQTIYFPTVEAFRTIVPPLPLQEQFAALVGRHERLRAVQRESLRQSDHLFASLLHQSFAGDG